MIYALQLAVWGTAALIGLGVALFALKVLKLPPIWALILGMVIFAGIQFPIATHAVRIDMPSKNSN